MYLCIYTYTYRYIYVYIHVYVYMHIHVYIYIHAYVYDCVQICANVHVFMVCACVWYIQKQKPPGNPGPISRIPSASHIAHYNGKSCHSVRAESRVPPQNWPLPRCTFWSRLLTLAHIAALISA